VGGGGVQYNRDEGLEELKVHILHRKLGLQVLTHHLAHRADATSEHGFISSLYTTL
jgi:hypothetical protein